MYYKPHPLLWAGCSGRAFLLMVDAVAELIDFIFFNLARMLHDGSLLASAFQFLRLGPSFDEYRG